MSKHWKWLLVLVLWLSTWAVGVVPVAAQPAQPAAIVLDINGEISLPMAEYLDRGLAKADRDGAELVILHLNTPGGTIAVMNRMIMSIQNSRVPVVVYISPNGAMAGSAGAIITLAAHASAMSPGTIIGAASPVGPVGEDIGQTMQRKLNESLKAEVRSYAERRPAEARDLAVRMIDDAVAVSAQEAYDAGLVDFLAYDDADLLAQLDGFQVPLGRDTRTLATTGVTLEPVPVTLLEMALNILLNPNIVFLLMVVGAAALLIELATPGGWVAGFIGVVCLALSAYGLGVLPINVFGLVFIVLAFVLFYLDVHAAAHGGLSLAGVGSLVVGALVLFNTPDAPSFQRISVPLVVVTSVLLAAAFFAIVTLGMRVRRMPVQSTARSLVGEIGAAQTDLTPRGSVQVASELWSAELVDGAASPLPAGAAVEVVAVEGIRLRVRPVENRPPGEPGSAA